MKSGRFRSYFFQHIDAKRITSRHIICFELVGLISYIYITYTTLRYTYSTYYCLTRDRIGHRRVLGSYSDDDVFPPPRPFVFVGLTPMFSSKTFFENRIGDIVYTRLVCVTRWRVNVV